jgi:hypothetical protein
MEAVMREGSDMFVERRRFPRYPCKGAAEVLVLQSGKSRRCGTVRDISSVGCYIETMYPLPTGAEAQLRFTIAGISMDIGANVVSSDPMVGMGMDFVVVPTEQGNKLPQIIAKVADVDLSPAVQKNGASHEETQPHMQAALQHLEQAHRELLEALHGEGGRTHLLAHSPATGGGRRPEQA